MQTSRFRNEEIIGFGVALFLHLALLGVLLLKPEPIVVEPIQTVTVSLAEDVGLEATAPEIITESRMAMSPTLSDMPAPPMNQPPMDQPQIAPDPMRTASPANSVTPRSSSATPKPRDRTTRNVAPKPKPDTSSRRRPDKPASQPASQPKQGGSSRRFDEAFAGSGSSTTSSETRAPAATLGAREIASLDSAIGRQVKVKWQGRVPQGPDAEKLVTRVRFRLKPDGSLAGEPVVVGKTSGVTDLNRNQVGRHQEEAVRAVKLAARFDVPFPIPQNLSTFTLIFDRNY